MLQTTEPIFSLSGDAGEARLIRPRRPFVFAFAIDGALSCGDTLMPGEITIVDVTDGRRRHPAADDWFASRAPAIPGRTGPLHVAGVCARDILEIEVLAIEPVRLEIDAPLLVTVAVADLRPGQPARTLQAAISPGGMVSIPAARPGGPLSFGPVLIRNDNGACRTWEPVAARVRVRCSVT